MARLVEEMSARDDTIDFVGFGGERMEKAGVALRENLVERAVMGVRKVSMHQAGFQEVLSSADLSGSLPDELVLIGVQPEREAGVSTLPGLISAGRYLQDNEAEEIVLGSGRARVRALLRTMASDERYELLDKLDLERPPAGIASQAFTARLITTCSI